MALSNVSGFPRVGSRRELKFATESYWRGEISAEDLNKVAAELRATHWKFMQESGINLIPSNDFSFYDNVLDIVALTGAVPLRYGHQGDEVGIDTYFAMARGAQSGGVDVTALEMLKWFDSNYHYLVPEIGPDTQFTLSSTKPFDEFSEAKALGITTVPVLVGPLTFLLLAKPPIDAPDFDPMSHIDRLLPVYQEVIGRLGELGAEWVQLDEPVLVEDRTSGELKILEKAYEVLADTPSRSKLLVKTYFGDVGEAYETLARLPIEGIGLDFHRGRNNLSLIESEKGLQDKTLFAGVVDGRNIWINDLEDSLELLGRLQANCSELIVSTSSSLLFVPYDIEDEPELDGELKSWLAFAKQKTSDVATLAKGLSAGTDSIRGHLDENRKALSSREASDRTRNAAVRDRVNALTEADGRRKGDYESRRLLQRERLGLPAFPTTTIGSYPQTGDIQGLRAKLHKGDVTHTDYLAGMRKHIEEVVRFQEKAGLDVLVHGEPERNDMVQYFAELLDGCATTTNGWVQSYGTRGVRPPIIFGDILRPSAMTLDWFKFAQSLTDRPMKGMLTGPVTMLEWSFVREDIPKQDTCKQMALAIRDEVVDLESAGARVIQVDEPAIREGLPLRSGAWKEYLDWAVYSFRVSTSGVKDETQIQTHLCYSEFGDIIEAIDDMDADVALTWCARAGMRLLDDLQRFGYRREVGPGVFDIHSPRVPSVEEMVNEIKLATERLDPERIWVNPDCGLKTRTWEEVEPSVTNMVAAAKKIRASV